jgi:hypothetical protein
MQEFGVLLEASPPFALQTKDDCSLTAYCTQQLWQESYPDEPFFLSGIGDRDEAIPHPKLLSGFDLLASTERQATFLWQVSGERFEDIDFLNEGVENYYKFLTLKPKAKHMVLVPTYQIDLMWHTHILSSLCLYNKDCTAMIGSTFHHDDSLNDRTEGGVLDTSYRMTKERWREEYGADYVVEGGMYRGEPPTSYFGVKWTAADTNSTPVSLEMGASSTSPTSVPMQWASVDGLTSDGLPAFIASNPRLNLTPRMPGNYVLGNEGKKVGYFHLETREAHSIICKQLSDKIKKLESDIAIEKCCCRWRPADIARKEEQLRETRKVLMIIIARHRASKPTGDIGGDQHYYADGYVWIYPGIIWDSCGGICEGNVACNTGTIKTNCKLPDSS